MSSTPRGGEISPDQESIVITFSNPLAATAATLPIKIEPAIDGFPERAAVIDDRVSYSVRALQPNTRYTITVDAAVADRFGQRMQGPHVAEFGTGDGTPRLDIETGAWVVEATRPGYPAWSRNLTSIEADITAVPEAKLGELAGQLDWWDQERAGRQEGRAEDQTRDHPDQGTEESVGPDPDRAGQAAGQRVAARRLLLHRPARARRRRTRA